MSARTDGLRIGDRIRFEARAHTVVGLSGTLVRLADEQGTGCALHLPHLLTSPGFEILERQPAPARVPPTGRLETLPQAVVERALWWEGHIVEVLTGRAPDAAPGTPVAPAYDPAARSLAQRERAKAAELAAAGEVGVSAGTVRRKRLRYQATGILGLVDHRADRRASMRGPVDARVVDALKQAIGEATDASSRTVGWFRWRTEQLLAQQHGEQAVRMPSRSAFYRLFASLSKGRHTTGSARTRRSLASRPDSPFGQVTAARPGELMQIDATPLDVLVLLADGVPGRVELCGMVDLATRSVTAAVLTPTTKSVDAALLLARTLTPEPMRPGWPEVLRMARSVLPHRHLLEVDERLAHAAARPVMVPETIVCDRGKAFLSLNFRSACQSLGISLQPAHPATPTDKPHIEKTLGSVATLFAQFVTGYLGSSTERRGRNVAGQPLWSMLELQNLLDEWLLSAWQNRPHDGLRDPSAPGRAFTPNERYAALVEAAGYVPVALSAEDYIELMPAAWRAVNAYGVKLHHRTYDSAGLGPFRGQDSGIAARKHLWEVHYDPYDVTRVWVRNHWGEGWITVPWRHLGSVPVPFGELAWDHARQQLGSSTQGDPADEQTIAAAVAALLEVASRGPAPASSIRYSSKDRRVAARTRAASARAWPAPAPPPEPPDEPTEPDGQEPDGQEPDGQEPDGQEPDGQEPDGQEPDGQEADTPAAKVVPLGIFDPYEEATKRW